MVPNSFENQPPEAPQALDWRAEAAWLRVMLASGGGPDTAATETRLRQIDDALAQPERTRPGALPNLGLAQSTIAAMKAGQAIEPEGIKAVVAAAEHGIEAVRSFGIRWDADMRAIRRWQAGDPDPPVGRLVEAASKLCDATAGGQGHGERAAVLAAIQPFTDRAAEAGRRELLWPDHADLVVWLLAQLEYEPPIPSTAEVEELLARLSTAIMASGGNPLAVDARKMLAKLAELLRWAMRQHFVSEEMRRQLGRQLGEAHVFLALARTEIGYAMQTYADHPDGMGDAYRAASATARQIEQLLESHGLKPEPASRDDLAANPSGADALAYGFLAPDDPAVVEVRALMDAERDRLEAERLKSEDSI